MRVIRPDLDYEQRRQEVVLGLVFVAVGTAIRARYDFPPMTRDDGAALVASVRHHLEG